MTIKSVLAVAVAAAPLATAPTIVTTDSHFGAKNITARAAESDIVDTAVAAGQFNTLAKALTAAGLIDATVIKTDIVAENDVIHATDAVVMPN